MTRAKFDRAEVIDRAIDVFWQYGFSNSSMQQISRATGLNPGSIYLAFGSKEGLFREALQRYGKRTIATITTVMEQAATVGEGICRIFDNLVHESATTSYCSCFLIKTQLELAAEGNELYRLASHHLEEIEQLYRGYLEKEWGPERGRVLAASVMLHIFGVRVYGYREDSVEILRAGLRQGLPWLPWSRCEKSVTQLPCLRPSGPG